MRPCAFLRMVRAGLPALAPTDLDKSDWAKAQLRLESGKRDGVYFAHVLAASR
jgi:hypothetical protein